jgi:hypothetical protein
VSLVPSQRFLSPGQSISLTTSATGGVEDIIPSRQAGGFATDATAGSFTAGPNSKVDGSGTKITHRSSFQSFGRTWAYGYTAANTPGLVEVYTVVNSVNGNSSNAGDAYGFPGVDGSLPTNPVPTPLRLYVLPAGLEFIGEGCADGFGNVSVLGSTEVPSVGNGNFGLEIAGASTNQAVALYGSFNSPGFQPVDLGPVGLAGCLLQIELPILISGTVTSPGEARQGEGVGFMPFPIPADPIFLGETVELQAIYIDPSAAQVGRFLPATLTNGLRLTVQM